MAPAFATYGVLAFIPGIEPSRNVLIIEGTSVAGTESIYDLLSNEEELNPLLKHFKAPDGSLMHFEVLLSAQPLNESASKFDVCCLTIISIRQNSLGTLLATPPIIQIHLVNEVIENPR